MDIFDIMDCIDCRYHHARDDNFCRLLTDSARPCSRMLGVIEDRINDGLFEARTGTVQNAEDLEEAGDFTSAPYWFVPDNLAEPMLPYQSIREIFDDFFAE